ncbi:unnamed protein product [Lepeophtheirus salmonis]|uniref:(salmon louse) hypothetical protein n=1 Tax=Lepeophtheirus salmonis TaxID=72036 RepID=A0A7R8CWK5_LEPSM|nr:unnamed protein product [Lepeophtheirus salmonis]CAF2953137.1 unnamed protein product [Lepeophtheirus salmonis]
MSFFQIPRITLAQLVSLKDGDEAINNLKDDGDKISAFYVSELGSEFNLTDFRNKAPSCIGENPDLPTLTLKDGSSRKTFATTDSELYPVCMGKTMIPLVDAYDRIEAAVIQVIQLILNGDSTGFSSETRGEKFILPLEESPVKDHIHVYMKNKDSHLETIDSIVPFHVDNGLFLILTPFPGHGIQLKSSKGTEWNTHEAESSDLVVLICRGLTDWFLQKNKAAKRKLFPAPHAVPPFKSPVIGNRSVYARMKVVPMDALPWIGGQPRGNKPFKYVFENSDHHENSESICSINLDQEEEESGRNSWLRMMDRQCAAGEAYCWMSCRPFRSECSSLEESICYSTIRNLSCSTQINGLPMDQSCKWECQKDVVRSHHKAISETPSSYCYGKMDMYMTGFEVQGSANGAHLCIVLFIEAWTLDSRLKFAFGCIGVFLLGFSIEALIALRRKISSNCRRILTFTGTSRKAKKALLISSFGLNLALG